MPFWTFIIGRKSSKCAGILCCTCEKQHNRSWRKQCQHDQHIPPPRVNTANGCNVEPPQHGEVEEWAISASYGAQSSRLQCVIVKVRRLIFTHVTVLNSTARTNLGVGAISVNEKFTRICSRAESTDGHLLPSFLPNVCRHFNHALNTLGNLKGF